MGFMNRRIIIALASFFIIGMIIGMSLRGCSQRWSGRGGVLLRSDTVVQYVPRVDTQWHTIELRNDIPYTVWGHDTVYVRRVERIAGHDTSWIAQYVAVTDTVAYSDTLREASEFKAEIFDTLAGNRIIGRSLRWANLTPIEIKTVTNTVMKKPALVKVFIGADAYAGPNDGKLALDVAPAASLVFTDRYMVDLGYCIFNRVVTAGIKVKLSLR